MNTLPTSKIFRTIIPITLVSLIMAFAMSPTFSAPPPDAEATKTLVGSWADLEKVGTAGYIDDFKTFNHDGTFYFAEKVGNRDTGKQAASEGKGKWRVKDGRLILQITEVTGNHPLYGKDAVGRIIDWRLVSVTKKQFRIRFSTGQKGFAEASYFRR